MNRILYIFGLVLLFVSCAKEDDLTPSGKDKDWFVIEDDSDAPVDKAIYAFYTKWQVPVFYNDTLGFEEREDGIFYKILDINYQINRPSGEVFSKEYSLVRDEESLLAGVRFLDQYLYPRMPDVFHQTSILLLDSLYEVQYGYPKLPLLEVYQGMETLAIANVTAIPDMSTEELESWANRILSYLTISYLGQLSDDRIEKFYKVSSDEQKGLNYYGMVVRPAPLYPGYQCLSSAHWETYGFLDCDRDKYFLIDGDVTEWIYNLPKQDADLEDFVTAILAYTPEDFEREYSEYPKVIEKFTILRAILEEQGIVE